MLINSLIVFSPLEQFEILETLESLTNILVFIVLPLFFVSTIFKLVVYKQLFFTHSSALWAHFFEVFVEQILLLVWQNLGVLTGQRYFTWLTIIFLTICSWNLIGIVPYAFTVTSQIVVTFLLAIIFFGGINLRAILDKRFAFFDLFVPQNAPHNIKAFLIVIELISYVARVFSLAIRLFANIIAGHTLLKILISFTFNLIGPIATFNWIFLFVGLIPFILITLITLLEVSIAVLQAYVFTVLLCLYIRDLHVAH